MKLTKLFWERHSPRIIAFLCALIWFFLCKKGLAAFPEVDTVLSSTLTVSGIFVGFLATCKAILISMRSSVLDDLMEAGYLEDLMLYLKHAIWGNLAFCVVNVVGYFGLFFFIRRSGFFLLYMH